MRYLNHAGTSWPKPEAVHLAVRDAEAASPDTWADRFVAAHGRIATHLGVPAETLLPTPSCTAALAVAVADVPWTPGDRVLTSSMEHHALVRPLAKVRDHVGIEVVEVPRAADGPLDLDRAEAELRRGRVKLVAVSMASNVTGEELPWRELVPLAHDHGALCLLDGAQVAGWHPLDLTAEEVDVFAFAGHKGPQAPVGIGGLYVRPGVPLRTPAATCDGELCRTGPGYCDTGSVSLPGLSGLAAGLDVMAEARPLAAALALTTRLRAALAALPGVAVHGGPPAVPTVSLTMAGRDPRCLSRALGGAGIVVRGGTQCAPRAHQALGTGDAGALRVSFGPGSEEADLDAVVEQLAAIR